MAAILANSFRYRTLGALLALFVLSPTVAQDKQTLVDETAFQLRPPPGWHKVQGTALASFESADKSVSLSVNRSPFDQ